MNGLTCRDITDILDDYDIKYSNISVKGDVDFYSQEIRINPLYKQDIETLAHEFYHIYYEIELEAPDIPEEIIESNALELVSDYKMYKCLEDYLCKRTKYQRIDYE
jgi:hypothetical protein